MDRAKPEQSQHGCSSDGSNFRELIPHIQHCWDMGSFWAQEGLSAPRELKVLQQQKARDPRIQKMLQSKFLVLRTEQSLTPLFSRNPKMV